MREKNTKTLQKTHCWLVLQPFFFTWSKCQRQNYSSKTLQIQVRILRSQPQVTGKWIREYWAKVKSEHSSMIEWSFGQLYIYHHQKELVAKNFPPTIFQKSYAIRKRFRRENFHWSWSTGNPAKNHYHKLPKSWQLLENARSTGNTNRSTLVNNPQK